MTSTRQRTMIGGAAALGLLGAGNVAREWWRYGRVAAPASPEGPLDTFIPRYEVREYHETRVEAPASVAFDAARALDLERSRLIRALFRAREILMGGTHVAREAPRGLLRDMQGVGWGLLADRPTEIVLGAVTQPWVADVHFRGLPPDEFAAFDAPGYVKIAWMIGVSPIASAASLVRTETRVVSTDAYARTRFRAYWTVIGPFVRGIRRASLRLVKTEAERRYRAAHREWMKADRELAPEERVI
jgi:hypothetical protein